MSKTFTIGDIHGAHKALLQCLERSGFNYKKDTLIPLGDVVDGWPEVPECIDELMKIKNLIYILGNHDMWLLNWFKFGARPLVWTEQGGQATLDAYLKRGGWDGHGAFLEKGHYKYIDDKNRIFCHGGFYRRIAMEAQLPEMFLWDRSLAEKAVSGKTSGFKVDEFEHVFIGHTTVNNFSPKRVPRNLPFTSGNVTLMDTGAGMEGKLTIMDVDTKEFWQSDIVKELYPDDKGRN